MDFKAVWRGYQTFILLIFVIYLSFSHQGSECDKLYTTSSGLNGTFKSPGYPKPYAEYSHCTFVFEGSSDDRVNISFDHFDLENGTHAGCLWDYIDIFTIDMQRRKHLEKRVCGQKAPADFISVHSRVELIFKSDIVSGNHKGFHGTYSFIGESWSPFPSSPECGSKFVTGVGGRLTSPGYPNRYKTGVKCMWMIKVQNDHEIFMNFVALDLGQSVHCAKTTGPHVAVYNGFASPDREPDDRFCGQLYFEKTGKVEFKSASYRVVVRFSPGMDDDRVSTGFHLEWTAVRLMRLYWSSHGQLVEELCPNFHCKGGEYCIDTENLLCNPLPRFCIAESLYCNGVLNCGAFDGSDEEGCWTHVVLLVVAVGGPIALLVGISMLVVVVHRRRQRARAEAAKAKAQEAYNESPGHDVYYRPTGVGAVGVVSLQKLERSPSVKRYPTASRSCHSLHGGTYSPDPRGAPPPHAVTYSPGPGAPPPHAVTYQAPCRQVARGRSPGALHRTYYYSGDSRPDDGGGGGGGAYGPVSDSCGTDTEQDYLSSCSNYGSPASLRLGATSGGGGGGGVGARPSYRAVYECNQKSVSATV